MHHSDSIMLPENIAQFAEEYREQTARSDAAASAQPTTTDHQSNLDQSSSDDDDDAFN